MRYPDNKFLEAYYTNIGIQTEQILEANPVVTSIIKFMDSRTGWIGTATDLLNELEEVAGSLKIKTKNNTLWPRAPTSLSRRLNEVKTNLREIGITIERPVDTTPNTRRIRYRKYRRNTRYTRKNPNQAQLQFENSGDIAGEIDSISLDISRQQMVKIMLKIVVQAIPEIPGDSIIFLLLLLFSASIHRLGHSDTFACENSNSINSTLLTEFYQYMKSNGASELI
ncbi:MAG TPA: hypothetical protein VFY68_03540 [Nitrososphaeraceae archaeon]|nr:hypothetical protein [Nitrososphaeraceae archaeon]